MQMNKRGDKDKTGKACGEHKESKPKYSVLGIIDK